MTMLRSARRYARMAVRALKRLHHHRLTATPVLSAKRSGQVDELRFDLRPSDQTRFPDGWVMLSLTYEASENAAVGFDLCCTYGAHDATAHQLRTVSANTVAALVQVTGGAVKWELRCTTRAQKVILSAIDAVEVTHAEAILRSSVHLAKARNWRFANATRLTRKAASILRNEGVSGLLGRVTGTGTSRLDAVSYARWIAVNEPRAEDHAAMRKRIEAFEEPPTFSVVMPVYNTPPHWLDKALSSVRAQLWPHWELCVADDASPSAETRAVLERHAAEDQRIRVVYRKKNGHISVASNSALEIARGDFVVLLDHDDELPVHALYIMAEYVRANPRASLLFSDEDKIDEDGKRFDPYFKPDWNPELFTSQNFVSHLGVYRRSLVEQVGGFRVGFEGSQDYDLALRVSEKLTAAQIVHVPHVLYHWRAIPGSTALHVDEKNYAVERARKALTEHVARRGVTATVEPAWDHAQYSRIRYAVPDKAPSVSIIVCTRDRVELLRTAVESILDRTTYEPYEIVVVDNQSSEPATLAYFQELAQQPRVRVTKYDEPFNFAAMNNFAAQQCSSDIYVLLNNDVEVITPDWLTELVSHAARPEIGCVGAMMYYPDDRIQHAGVILGINGVAGHVHRMLNRGTKGSFSRAALVQNLSAVTAACVAVRREVYWKVGGLDADLAVAFNDVDFCIRVRDSGYRNVWTPYAELYHYESASRGQDIAPERKARFDREVAFMQARWGKALIEDPAYNPNLRLDDEYFGLASKSRAWKPWLDATARHSQNAGFTQSAAESRRRLV